MSRAFKVGDKVRRRGEYRDSRWFPDGRLFEIVSISGSALELNPQFDSFPGPQWDAYRFELAEEDIRNTNLNNSNIEILNLKLCSLTELMELESSIEDEFLRRSSKE